jgi:L-asparaginase/Glu-tRNA(Gln) amidotransferase subunit D
MQTIYLIRTGGTIEKVYSEQSDAVLNRANKIGQFLDMLRLPDCDGPVIPLMNKDNLEMTQEDRAWLVSELALLLLDDKPIVITHGTDTMVEAWQHVGQMLPDLYVPIIFTGMRVSKSDSSCSLMLFITIDARGSVGRRH